MKQLKLTFMLFMALLPVLAWPLALSAASTPLVAQYGVWGGLFFAGAISAFAAWLITGFLQELLKAE